MINQEKLTSRHVKSNQFKELMNHWAKHRTDCPNSIIEHVSIDLSQVISSGVKEQFVLQVLELQ